MAPLINLVGRTFSRLTVIEELPRREDKKGKRFFKCECSCEAKTIKIVEYSKLKYGSTKSCGCLNDELKRSRFKDLTDQTFGRLTALYKLEERKNASIVWMCKCSCEKETLIPVPSKDLLSGNTNSCGCWLRDVTSNMQAKNEEVYYQDDAFVSLLTKKVQNNSTTGVKGVSIQRRKNGDRYVANIILNGVNRYLGVYKTIEEAAAARIEAEEKLYLPIIKKWEEQQNDK